LPEATANSISVVILADDLIWATRLMDAVVAAGATARPARRLSDIQPFLAEGGPGSRAIVDLTARAYDGVEAVRVATAEGARVVAVGQHDDLALRRAALAAGAERVFAYRALFEDGPGKLAAWLRQ